MNDIKLKIIITTFEKRMVKYFFPLLSKIKKIDKENKYDIIVCVNGEPNGMSNQYRRDILQFISQYDNVYPIMFPVFRGLSKLWNTGIIHANNGKENEYVLVLNDDISIVDNDFLKNLEHLIIDKKTSFKLNGSFSHFVGKINEIIECNFFDERLIFLGQEDGDFIWRYENHYNRLFQTEYLNGIINHVDMNDAPEGIEEIKSGNGLRGKYSKKNEYFMTNLLYKIDNKNGVQRGIYPLPLVVNEPLQQQYPYEDFNSKNK